MDFARKQLEKYGWTEGKGLGKHETGISKAIRPKLKFDNSGIGHNPADQFTYHWWENVYNQAANNINVKKTKDSINVELNDDSIEITTSKYVKLKKSKKTNDKMEYGVFLKKSTLTSEGLQAIEVNVNNDETNTITDGPKLKSNSNSGISSLTDEEIFKACGGRTAHKGARHGLNLKGKLARIAEQEQQLLNKMKENSSKNVPYVSEKRTGISPLLKPELSEINNQNPDKICATDRFLHSLNATSNVPKSKHSKKKCEYCYHKRCRCNVFDAAKGHEITSAPLGKRKLFGIHDSLTSLIGANSKYERIRDPNGTSQIYNSPYSENAQNKRRKLGVSWLEEEANETVQQDGTIPENKKQNRKIKKKSKKIKRQVSKLSDSLDRFNIA